MDKKAYKLLFPDMPHIISVEFQADTIDQLDGLIKELQSKYDIACRKKEGVRINGWSNEELP